MHSSALRCGSLRHRIKRGAAGLVALAGYLVFPVAAGGGSVQAATQTLTASTATGAQIVLGQPIRITIAAKSDTLISGKIIVSSDSSSPAEYDIEVPAGTTKELTVIGMPLDYPQAGYSVTWVDDNGKMVANTNLRSALRGGDTVVGVFSSVGTDFPERINQPTGTDSYLFTIPEQQLDFPAVAFAQYDVIIAMTDDIERLDGDLLSAFEFWLASGGRLVLDDGDASTVASTLKAAQPDGRYGQGEIVSTAGELRDGGWESATRPIAARSVINLGPIGWMTAGGIGAQSMTQSLVKYSGTPLIGTVWLFLLIVGYAAIVGPVMFIVFRRRRRSLWVVGPVIATVACGLIWLDSNRRRNAIADAHGTVVQVDDVASTVASSEMMYVRSGKPVGVTLPPTFAPVANYDGWDSQQVQLGPDGATVRQTADQGSFVVYTGSGPAKQFDRQLTGTVTIDDDGVVSGEITNHLEVDLHQVAVMTDQMAKNIGDVPAGETVAYTIDKSNRVEEMAPFTAWGEAFTVAEWGMPEPKPNGLPRPDLVSPAVWDSAATANPTIGATENVDVIGWTDQLNSPITGSSRGVSAVMTRLELAPLATEGESAYVYAAESVNAMNWSADALIRLEAPIEGGDLAVKLPKAMGSPELLVDGEWVEIDPAGKSVAIPADALDDHGGLYLKTEVNLEQVAGGSIDLPRLHKLESDEDTVSLQVAISKSAKKSTESGSE